MGIYSLECISKKQVRKLGKGIVSHVTEYGDFLVSDLLHWMWVELRVLAQTLCDRARLVPFKFGHPRCRE